MLLTNFHELSRRTFRDGYPRDFVEWAEAMEDRRASRQVARENYPLMVTFTDIADPASVTRVDLANLAATFGPGYALTSLTLETTDEPVTSGRVEKVLGWWCGLRKAGARLSGSTSIAITSNELVETLGAGAFKVGDCK